MIVKQLTLPLVKQMPFAAPLYSLRGDKSLKTLQARAEVLSTHDTGILNYLTKQRRVRYDGRTLPSCIIDHTPDEGVRSRPELLRDSQGTEIYWHHIQFVFRAKQFP